MPYLRLFSNFLRPGVMMNCFLQLGSKYQMKQQYTNTTIGRFLTSNMEKIIRRTRKSDIADFLSNLDAAMQAKFNAAVPTNTVTVYTNVITARHNVGHRQGSNITLQELEAGITAAEKILDELDNCFV